MPSYSGIWILSIQLKKNAVEAGPPLTKLSGSPFHCTFYSVLNLEGTNWAIDTLFNPMAPAKAIVGHLKHYLNGEILVRILFSFEIK